MKKFPVAVGLAAVAMLASGISSAQTTSASAQTTGATSAKLAGWYGGISVGRSIDRTGGGGINTALGNQGITGASTLDRRDWTGSLFAGYRFTPNFALEGGLTRLGRFDYRATTTAPTAGTITGRREVEGLELNAVGTYPLADRISLYGKVGLFHGRTRLEANGTGVAASSTRSWDTSPIIGIGASYALSRNWDARVEWDRYLRVGNNSTGRGDIDRWVVGGAYHFQ